MSEPGGAPDGAAQLASLVFAAVLLDENQVIAEANHAAEDMLGMSASRLVGKTLLDVVEIGDARVRETLTDVDAKLIARGIELRAGERDLSINLTSSPIAGYNGWRVITLSDSGQDDEPDEPQAELRAPAVLAHEIKNPLSAIRGASQLLARRVDEKDRPLTSMIAGESDRIANLIDRMQQLGSRPSVETGPCNLHEAVRNAMATVRAAKPEGPRLVEEFDPSLPRVEADQGTLEQVLINLLTNACDAACEVEDAEISVRTRYISGMSFSAMRFGKTRRLPIEVTVSDPGPGIDPSLRDHVFEPFVSGKSHGQGLGLALVRKLLRDMGGRISHQRDERAGLTHFRIHLALAEEG